MTKTDSASTNPTCMTTNRKLIGDVMAPMVFGVFQQHKIFPLILSLTCALMH
ncbi:hypothetical protein AtNW77_Chr3g0182001 [Arabidopsis thaliana]|uniref:Uncharacterized protein n=2 Tax=Arabidopsis TaxID=3701 RepID=B3H4R3_ARATH|nr:uncharacterized protein AT3G22723 [Arabidopsis thaliana]AEE76670.1 hypothetical protein AT3G22723 [Arabidopsis thaliana]KAG7626229.1 hypothetical protein ISN45_At03g023920 [Arabidopsis thaliana x Arabidopsis arenosa]|eukprot:NP_001118678.1 hypothetical protein AT3G22723 [Arabidopsis thaliana]